MPRGRRGKKKRADRDSTAVQVAMMKAEESAGKAEDDRRKLFLEHQAEEERLTRLNMHKIDEQWRKLMRGVKLDELKDSVSVLAQEHEHAIDVRDSRLETLDKNLGEGKVQYNMAVRAHNRHVDEIIQVYQKAAAQLEEEFRTEVDTLHQEFEREKTDIAAQHGKDVTELNDIIKAMEVDFEQSEAEARQEFLSRRSAIKNKNTEAYETLKQTQHQLIKDLEAHFDEAHAAYLFHSREDTEFCEAYMRADETQARTIEHNTDRLERLQQELQHWRVKHQNNIRECEERNDALRQEKNAVSKHFQALKAKMNKMRGREERRLLQLTKDSSECIKSLERRLERASRILSLAAMASKLEGEREKILPFYESTVEDEEVKKEMEEAGFSEENVKELVDFGDSSSLVMKLGLPGVVIDEELEAQMHAFATDNSGNPIPESDLLERFYKRFNKTLLDKMVLERHQQALQRENKELKNILRQYLDGISVNPDVLAQDNSLLVVNQRTNVPIHELARVRQVQNLNGRTGQPVYNVVEAATVMATPSRIK